MQPTTLPHPQDADYEDLLSLWADLESGLAMVLGNPLIIPDFERKLHQYDRWMQDLLRQDTDTALYLLFQLATNASVGYSALHAALLFTPWPLGIILAAPQAGKLSDRYPPIALSSAGLAMFTLGLVLLALLPAHAQAWDICWRGFICGIGFGFFQSPNNREMLSNTAREHSANASGVLAIMRTFGQCFGAALMGIILSVFGSHLAHGAGTLASAAQDANAIRLSLWVAAAATALATVISLSRLRTLKKDVAPSRPPASP